MPHVTHYLPELQDSEKDFIQNVIDEMSRDQAIAFASAYRQRRKDPHTVLLTSIVGLFAFPGFQRFWLGQIGMGFMFLFTWGLLLVGSISDLIRYKTLALTYNQFVAHEIASNIASWKAVSRLGSETAIFGYTEFV